MKADGEARTKSKEILKNFNFFLTIFSGDFD
jgi:hypothetical protein